MGEAYLLAKRCGSLQLVSTYMSALLVEPSSSLQPSLLWYALRVRARSEQLCAAALKQRGYESFCPTYKHRRRYFDRVKTVENVVFPGYLFCRFDFRKKNLVLGSYGIQHIVGIHGVPMPIPDQQISDVRRTVEAGGRPTPFTVGQRVRVEVGPLAGVEGVLVRDAAHKRLVVSVALLQRSVTIHVTEDQVRAG